jgi:hypothetical protein
MTNTNTASTLTREDIHNVLNRSDKALGRALLVLMQFQTEDEKIVLQSKYTNMRGFKKADAFQGTKDAQFFADNGYLTEEMVSYWRTVTKQGPRLNIYWRQLLIAAERKAKVQAIMADAQNYRDAKEGIAA